MSDSEWQWVLDESLSKVFARLIKIYKSNPDQIEGKVMAYAIVRLLRCESKPGGPYKDNDGVVKENDSKLIKQFIRLTSNSPSKALKRNDDKANVSTSLEHELKQMNKEANVLISKLPPDIGTTLAHSFKKITHIAISKEIALLSFYFKSSLSDIKIRPQVARVLGIANLFTWIAYTIFDDFYDDEGQPSLLPTALASARYAQYLYNQTWQSPASEKTIEETFNLMDSANSWEITKCRAKVEGDKFHLRNIPNYGNYDVLANRALAHVLGPVLIINNSSVSSSRKSLIKRGLKHYLIARQLNDDIHDWSSDLLKGHITSVVALLLTNLKVRSGTYHLSSLTKKLEKCFWKDGLDDICNITLLHIERAKDNLLKAGVNLDNELGELIAKLEQGTNRTQQIHKKQKEFLSTYKKLTTKEY